MWHAASKRAAARANVAEFFPAAGVVCSAAAAEGGAVSAARCHRQ